MASFLHLMFGIAISLALAMFSKLSKSFYNIQNSSPQFKVSLNLKRSHIFVVAKIGQTNFEKSRILQGVKFLCSWNFCLCILFSKIPKVPFSWENGTVCFMGIFLCIQNWLDQVCMIKCLI